MKKEAKILLLILFMSLLITGCGKVERNNLKDESNNIKGNNGKADIIETIVSRDQILMLNSKNELYAYGDSVAVDKVFGEPKLIASNVKKLYDGGTSIYYIDNNDNLYYNGLGLHGGTTSDFELIASDVKEVASCQFAVIYTNKNDELFFEGASFGGSSATYCGWKEGYSESTNSGIRNVKYVFGDSGYTGYVDENNDLYWTTVKNPDGVYEKILSDVVSVSTRYALTKDGTLYLFTDFGDEVIKIADNVEKIQKLFYKTKDGKFYTAYSRYDIDYDSPYEFKYNDIKEMFFGVDQTHSAYGVDNTKIVYLNNDNKIVLKNEVDSYVIDYSINSMKQIYDFLQ